MLKGRRGNIDLVEACAWGICSGGFACFYHGGTYVEDEPGQKRREVSAYFDKYREQVRSICDIPTSSLS